ncbi:MAG: hypothetical protein A7316_05200 [Candidatus Altiarchaeales archaeon WOR_SM1_86-2]|nr:MAG: hypothetical protein A7316_05200 [Candidatus Altiarchaeales archaeon WOR_SM1_86-2]ODS41098.1 MAG: hypothetical protein A7315_06965 [Candidatus Altiarchaeales archaeon WOR_SM1_79]
MTKYIEVNHPGGREINIIVRDINNHILKEIKISESVFANLGIDPGDVVSSILRGCLSDDEFEVNLEKLKS